MTKIKKDIIAEKKKTFLEITAKKKALAEHIKNGKSLKEFSEKTGVKFYAPV